jgi:hypothetical protein
MKTNYNNQKIASYLLGILPEEEAEHFDELSFTDDDFAEELKAVETDLVDAYLNNELRGTTLEQFKSYYLSSPLRREKVEFARSFQRFAEKDLQSPASSEKTKIAEIEQTSKGKYSEVFSFLNPFSRQIPVLQWGFAAVALLFLGLTFWLAFENSRLKNQFDQVEARRNELQQQEKQLQEEIARQRTIDSEKEKELSDVRGEIAQLEKELELKHVTEKEQERPRIAKSESADVKKQTPEPRPNIIASFVLTPQLRGSSQLQTLQIPAKTNFAAMRLELELDDFPIYRVALKNQADGKILWQSGKTKSYGKNKAINIRLPANLLKSQIYSLQVSGIAPNGEGETVSDYSFRVIR